MNPSSLESLTVTLMTIARSDRWHVYQRLQSLDIPCCCADSGAIEVTVQTPTTVAQIRSVVQQLTASRTELIDWLECCWRC